jgi:serine/threonine-protein kinase
VNDTGSFYYVMELLEGLDLHQIVTRFGPQSASRVVWLLRQACRSLSEAHDRGLVHRDIKPANLFVARLGAEYDYLKVLDFGIVKDQPGKDAAHLTGHGFLQGTPAYIAPELAFGRGPVDGRADLYSLACAAYFTLTGQTVFSGFTPADMLLHHAQTEPAPPSAASELPIPRELDDLVLQCLSKDPRHRPDSALALEQALARVGVEPWTEMRARRWWELHAPEIFSQ